MVMIVKAYEKENELFEIELDSEGKVISAESKTKSIMNPFAFPNSADNQTKWEGFLKSRVFDKARGDRDELLALLELSEYNRLQIAKKTHGVMLSDYVWLNFDGEDFGWEDANDILQS